MTKLDESAIIKIFQDKLENKKFVSEDVETFCMDKTRIVVKVDTLVQSTDIPPKMKLVDAARKSVVACISDFASKGVKPEFGIISLNLPKSISRTKVIQIASGLKTVSKEFQIKILGGDTNEGAELVFHVCIFGKSDKIVTRKGARSGDSIFVTGPFGYT
ncbi:MAG: AIR synthase related protein, partial [Nitrosopumilus sp.]|nr:AIR synthase related protein [Nitrosopumilus sp.]